MSKICFTEDFKAKVRKEFQGDFPELDHALVENDFVFIKKLLYAVLNFPEAGRFDSERPHKMRELLRDLEKIIKDQEMQNIQSLNPLLVIKYFEIVLIPRKQFFLGESRASRIVMVFDDGTIMFTGGQMAGSALEAKTIHGFWLENKAEDLLFLGLNFQRGDKIDSITLGVVEDKLTAQKWIDVVNELYIRK